MDEIDQEIRPSTYLKVTYFLLIFYLVFLRLTYLVCHNNITFIRSFRP